MAATSLSLPAQEKMLLSGGLQMLFESFGGAVIPVEMDSIRRKRPTTTSRTATMCSSSKSRAFGCMRNIVRTALEEEFERTDVFLSGTSSQTLPSDAHVPSGAEDILREDANCLLGGGGMPL
eukprot:5868621-Pleurochrysis_carterae.AAC.1